MGALKEFEIKVLKNEEFNQEIELIEIIRNLKYVNNAYLDNNYKGVEIDIYFNKKWNTNLTELLKNIPEKLYKITFCLINFTANKMKITLSYR